MEQTNWKFLFHKRQVIPPGMSCRQRFSVGWTWRVSIPTPFHSISFPPWEEGNMFELVDRACHTYMYMYMFGFQKTFIIVCLSYRLQASTEVLCTFGTVLLLICTGREWCRNSRGAVWWRLLQWYVLGLDFGPGGLGAWAWRLLPGVSLQWQWKSSQQLFCKYWWPVIVATIVIRLVNQPIVLHSFFW